MKITKRLAAVALSICISLSALTGLITPANAVNVDAAEFNSKLASFKAEKYANNSIYQNNPRLTGGYECFGYANELAIYVWGSYPTNSMSAVRVNDGWSVTYGGAAVDNLCVGDIVRYWCHSIFITGIDGDTVYYCQANYPEKTNKVTYDNCIARSTLKNQVSNQLTSWGTDRTGWVAHYTNAGTYTVTCKHEYNNKGICALCGEAYAFNASADTFSATTLKQINLKSSPYAAQTTVRTLKSGMPVSIVASALNHYGNKWYKTSAGDWLYSGDVAEQKPKLPQAPSGLSAKQDESDTASISWNEVNGAAYYEVQYRRSGINWKADSDYKTKTATSYISTGLADYDSYDYRVRAVNAAGYSPWSEFTYTKPVKKECEHRFDDKGICSLCGKSYSLTLTNEAFQAKILKDINLKALPYAAQSTTRRLTKDTVVTIVASAVNHYNNKWYKTADGDWLYSEDVAAVCQHQFKSYSEEKHPHYNYRICGLCGFKEATEDTTYHSECTTCNPPAIPTEPPAQEVVAPSVPAYQMWKNSDSRWSSVSLGGGATIGGSGGLVVSLAIAMADCGATSESYTPADLVASLKAVGGLTSSGSLVWDKVSSAVPGFEEQTNVNMKSGSLSVAQKVEMIRQVVDKGYQVIVQIPKSSPWGLRYVAVDRVENGIVYMFDPNGSGTDLFATYGNYPNVAVPYAY